MSVLNYSTEEARKPTTHHSLFLITINSPQFIPPSEMIKKHHNSHFTITEAFPGSELTLSPDLEY